MRERSAPIRRLALILEDREWSYRRLARTTGYSYQHFCRVMRGEMGVPLRFLVACELALNLPAGLLSQNGKETVNANHHTPERSRSGGQSPG